MAERRFAALEDLRKRQSSEAAPALPSRELPVAAAEKVRGRPPGKRSDPGWKPRTILMQITTHRRVSGLLLDQDEGPDLSELIDQLLREWISTKT